jgi:hypothetical protein
MCIENDLVQDSWPADEDEKFDQGDGGAPFRFLLVRDGWMNFMCVNVCVGMAKSSLLKIVKPIVDTGAMLRRDQRVGGHQ